MSHNHIILSNISNQTWNILRYICIFWILFTANSQSINFVPFTNLPCLASYSDLMCLSNQKHICLIKIRKLAIGSTLHAMWSKHFGHIANPFHPNTMPIMLIIETCCRWEFLFTKRVICIWISVHPLGDGPENRCLTLSCQPVTMDEEIWAAWWVKKRCMNLQTQTHIIMFAQQFSPFQHGVARIPVAASYYISVLRGYEVELVSR